MAREFMWSKPDGTWSSRGSLSDLMAAARKQTPSAVRKYALVRDGKKIRSGPRRWVLRGLRRGLEAGKPGPQWRLWGKGRMLFVGREVVPAVHIININGNRKADKAWSAAKAEFHDINFLGSYVCKHIAGTGTPSQHSYGNAVDFGRANMNLLEALAHWFVAHAIEFDLNNVICGNAIWSWGSDGKMHSSYYGGVYHYHVHVDFHPVYSGGCGVRG